MTDVPFTAAITHEGDWYFEDEPLPAEIQSPIIGPVEISVRAA